MMKVSIHCKKIVLSAPGEPEVVVIPSPPKLGSSLAAGMDLQCLTDFTVEPGAKSIVETGLIVKPPRGYCTLILSRSGLAAKHQIQVLNAPGLIDRDYCGPNDTIKVILKNHGGESVDFKAGDRVAQLLFVQYETADWAIEIDPNFARGEDRGGLGSTGA